MGAYQQLDFRIQKWCFQQGWTALREIQQQAVAPILSQHTDVLISAATAAGKTEAFFLPACSAVADQENGVSILYISPLKALINDQDRRLESLADLLSMRVTPWHGDSSVSRKKQLRKSPSGIILITPESLESLLIREADWVRKTFSQLQYIAIDEFHAFIGTERGHHLLSLLNRLEHLLGRLKKPIPRVALSATLGRLNDVPQLLRPNQSFPCEIIKDLKSVSVIKIQVRGYCITPVNEDQQQQGTDSRTICQDLFKICRGSNHLIFTNSRNNTEAIAAQLSHFCAHFVVPNEFFPHHGSLAKEHREQLEKRLQREDLPTTAVCTMTLELGIDIGKVDSVIQVTPPSSVSGLRQRMGRSGRRGQPAKLRVMIEERALNKNANIADKMRLQLIQSLAMVRLLIEKQWFEPADTTLCHFSTLLHQTLAIVAQWGGIRADQLYSLLSKEGPFQKVCPQTFKSLLIHMGQEELLTQLQSGELVLGIKGEAIVGHYAFYAAFNTPEEYRIIFNGKTLGTLPVDSFIMEDQYIVFGGKFWKVTEVNNKKKTVSVVSAAGGQPPKFGGNGISIHDTVRQEMFHILKTGDYRIAADEKKVDFVNKTAQALFAESVSFFAEAKLDRESVVHHGNATAIFTWRGDKVTNTIAMLLAQQGFKISVCGGVIEAEKSSPAEIKKILRKFAQSDLPNEYQLAKLAPETHIEKFDKYLPEDLLLSSHGARTFSVQGAREWLSGI
ncbi:MAG: DEAD/DEAH box helicase [Endozoicomonadaceae bacterium]|nr:DEAD/DEAH box helicase [Endozoicomonadaceae bacterium]